MNQFKKVGAIVLAGGQGTRLKVTGPKGCYPISVIQKKSLFQLLAEKVVSLSKQIGYDLPLAIMTSQENTDETVRFFKEHKNFGLHQDQLFFFTQDSLPLLDMSEKPMAVYGASGNGAFFKCFLKSGLFSKWQKKGIEYVTVMLVENALNDPYDAELLEQHIRDKNEVTVKGVPRENPFESVGVFVTKNKQLHVVEYSELSEAEKTAKNPDGTLKYPLANLSYFCFNMPFIQKMAETDLPLHTAKKVDPKTGKAFLKREYFIFDVLPFASKAGTFETKRKDAFAPLKNSSGEDSPETVHKALLAKDREIFEKISQTRVDPKRVFELSMDFHYPTEELKKKWYKKSLPKEDYITA